MRTPIGPLQLVEPRSVGHALHLLREARADSGLIPLAGCTDLFVSLNFGTLPGCRFLNLWPLASLRDIRVNGSVLTIGALATYTDIINSAAVRRRLPILVAASREVGGVQIQNRGTIGGNIANASPAGDTLPVLAAAEAVVVLRNADRTRRVPFNNFYKGYRQSVMDPDELIVAIEIPPLRGAQWFRKVGTRAAQAISKVVMAGIRGPQPRIALGSVAPTVIRAWNTEQALAAGRTIDEAARTLAAEINPIDDLRSTAEYRHRVVMNLLSRFWVETDNRRKN